MFYRFETNYETHIRLGKKTIDLDKIPLVMENIESGEIALSPPWPKCQVFRAKVFGPEFFRDIKIEAGKEEEEWPDIFKDIFPIVSEKVRDVIEDVDDFKHHFVPVTFFDHKDNVIDKGQYYYFQILRLLRIEEINKIPNVDFSPADKFLATIQKLPELREKVESLPIWKKRGQTEFYLNEALVSRSKQENLKYFEEITINHEFAEECLGHVW